MKKIKLKSVCLLSLLSGVMAIFFSVNVVAATDELKTKPPIVLIEDHKGIGPANVAIIVNTADPQSIAVAEYYRMARRVPAENVISIDLKVDEKQSVLDPKQFAAIKQNIDQQLPNSIQAYVLAWTAPYRVGCMSITSAFAYGFDERYCATGCKKTKHSDYFGSESRQPWQDHQIRPAMMLAGNNFTEIKNLIDRGVKSDGSFPVGDAYLLETSDRVRSARRIYYPLVKEHLSNRLPIYDIRADSLQNKKNVMFYFTGLSSVSDLDTNDYLPGAVADHLTSYGGQLTDSSQMSSLRWIEAGVTGSYGTVVEPCAFTGKFPNPLLLMEKYLAGEHLIEAYWKSVEMPGQGVFIGEPLARPWYGYQFEKDENNFWHLHMPLLKPGYYRIEGAYSENGPFTIIARGMALSPISLKFVLASGPHSVWRIVPEH